jgi:hypothetical protein
MNLLQSTKWRRRKYKVKRRRKRPPLEEFGLSYCLPDLQKSELDGAVGGDATVRGFLLF